MNGTSIERAPHVRAGFRTRARDYDLRNRAPSGSERATGSTSRGALDLRAACFAFIVLTVLVGLALPAAAQMDDLERELDGAIGEPAQGDDLDDELGGIGGDDLDDEFGGIGGDDRSGSADVPTSESIGAGGAVPALAISTVIEDGESLILATVTLGDMPLEGVGVSFFVRRTFGLLKLGDDRTLDDGTAAAPFPVGLPGDAEGNLEIVVRVTDPPTYTVATAETRLSGAPLAHMTVDAFPRALWAPEAPWGLLITIMILVGVVWAIFLFVVVQLLRLRGAVEPDA